MGALELPKKHEEIKWCKIPRKLSESSVDGMYWAAGFVAMRMKDIQHLGDIERDATNDHAKNSLFKLINRGGAAMPLKTWLKDYMKMEAFFQEYHPKGSVRPDRGLMARFFIKLKEEFPYYLDPVLFLVTKILTRFRIRALNKVAKKKRLQKKGPKTARGRKKQVEISF